MDAQGCDRPQVEHLQCVHMLPTGLQFASVAGYALSSPTWPPSLAAVSPPLALVAVVCIAAGQVSGVHHSQANTMTRYPQALNVGIYKAIGHAGVYYGFKLGHHVPWHTGFPFNVVAHPQCVYGDTLAVDPHHLMIHRCWVGADSLGRGAAMDEPAAVLGGAGDVLDRVVHSDSDAGAIILTIFL